MKAPPGIVYDVREILEGLQTSGVDRRHVSQTKEFKWKAAPKAMDDLFDFVVAPKRKGP